MAVLLFHQQQFEKYATLLHVLFSSAVGLVVEMFKICELKVTNTTMN
jgi:hypothetical protein